MKTCTSLTELQTLLPTLGPVEASFALVFLQNTLDAADIEAIREAIRVCDVAVVACIGTAGRDKAAQDYLKHTGIHALYQAPEKPKKTKATVTLATTGIDGIQMLQTLLAIMPSMVVASPKRRALSRALDDIIDTFPNIFVKRMV